MKKNVDFVFNKNQTSKNTFAMPPLPPNSSSQHFISKYRRVLTITLVVVGVVVIVAFGFLRILKLKTPASLAPTSGVQETRTDFGVDLPAGFPDSIPFESGVRLNQSYRLDYPGQKQLTVAFSSRETMQQNFEIYKDFFKKNSWVIMNTYEGDDVQSIYALKGASEVNVTMNKGGGVGSEVSISVLEK